MMKFFKVFILTFIMVAVSISVGYADSNTGCSYEFFCQDFEDNASQMEISSGTVTVTAPVNESQYKTVIKIPYLTTGSSYCGPNRTVLTERFSTGELKRIVVSVDVLFKEYVEGNFALFGSGTEKNTVLCFSKGLKGFATDYKDYTNWGNYSKFSLNQWYNLKVDLDLVEQKFSLWINDCKVTSDAPLKSKMSDFQQGRLNFGKITESGDSQCAYADNFTYYVPYGSIYKESCIELEEKNGILSVTAVAPGNNDAVLLIGKYSDRAFEGVIQKDSVLIDGVPVAQHSFSAEKGKEYKFFLFDSIKTIVPLCVEGKFYRYTDYDYEELKDRWKEFLVGGEVDSENTWITSRINDICFEAQDLQDTMDKAPNATSLWGEDYNESSDLGVEYKKIYAMALAYGTKGQALYKNESLKNDIIYALDWMYNNRYGQAEIAGTGWRSTMDYNWWDWLVSAPTYIVDITMILHDDLSQAKINNYFSLYNHLVDTMRTNLNNESNVRSRAYAMFGAAVMQKDKDMLEKITAAYPILFSMTDSGTGMYEDYSYITHNMIPYTGDYGTGSLLDRIVPVMSITAKTPYELPQLKSGIFENWIFNAFEPILTNAVPMSMVRGRAVESDTSYENGMMVFESMLDMMDSVSEENAYKFKMMIKRHLTGERLNYAYRKLSLPRLIKLVKIINDESLPEPEPYENTRVYYNMDRMVHHKNGWSAGLAMSSERVANYESINHNNMKGWYTGDGMLYLHTQQEQYDASYFINADPYKRPGTTVDSQTRQEVSVASGQEYFSSKDFVGGVSLNNAYGVAAMDLESFHNDTLQGAIDVGYGGDQPLHNCDLIAKKAWFMFDEEIVCLGADINATQDYEVFTTVENRKIRTYNSVVINEKSILNGAEGTVDSPQWAFITGTGGYYFPDGGTLKYRRINNSNIDRHFFEMWLSHGNAPENASYSYVILPLKSQEETIAYCNNPQIKILSNTEKVQVVSQKTTGVTGYVFWSAGNYDGITVSHPVTLMKKETDNDIEIAFSDPTHKLNNIEITLDGVYQVKEFDKEITVKTSNGKTVISGDLAAIDGKSLKVVLAKN